MLLTCLLFVQGTGLIQPGEQLTQLLLAAAAQLTSLMVGAIPLSRENTGGGTWKQRQLLLVRWQRSVLSHVCEAGCPQPGSARECVWVRVR